MPNWHGLALSIVQPEERWLGKRRQPILSPAHSCSIFGHDFAPHFCPNTLRIFEQAHMFWGNVHTLSHAQFARFALREHHETHLN
jgi:hypothetical protein